MPYDQRGFPYRRIADGNDPTDVVIDMGAVERQPQPADFNLDMTIDGFDFLIWQRGAGATSEATHSAGDANGDDAIDGIDLNAWQATYGQHDPGEVPPRRLVDVAGVASLRSEQLSKPVSSPAKLASRADMIDAALATASFGRKGAQPQTETGSTAQSEAVHEAVFASEPSAILPLPAPPDRPRNTQPAEDVQANLKTEPTWLADELLDRVFG